MVMSTFRQLLSRFARLEFSTSSPTRHLTNLTPPLCLLPEPAFDASPPTVDDLPPELLVLILEHAGPDAILAASAVSRRFREIVGGSSALKYRVALVLAGMQDAGDFSNSGSRLRALAARSAAWRSFQYRDQLSLEIGDGALRPCYDLHSGVFFVGRRTSPNLPIRTLTWLPLPSLDNRGCAEWQSMALDISIDDFALDLRQDLLVLVEMLVPGATMVHLHLRSFKGTCPHPKASFATLALECAPVSPHSTIVVDLAGKHLGLLFSHDHQTRSDQDRICIWDWTTGETVFLLQGSSTKLTSFVFLADNVLLVPDVAANALSVFSMRTDDGQFELTDMFALPPLRDDCVLHNANSRYKSRGVHKPAPGAHTLPGELALPGFYVAPEMELVVISLEYRTDPDGDPTSHFFTLIATKASFLGPTSRPRSVEALATAPLPHHSRSAGPLSMPTAVAPSAAAQLQPHAAYGPPASLILTPPIQSAMPPHSQVTTSHDLATAPESEAPTHDPAESISCLPWDAWGPAETRIIREPLRLWDYFHASTRFISLTPTSHGGVDDEDSGTGYQRQHSGPRQHIRVLEFHPQVVAKAGGRASLEAPIQLADRVVSPPPAALRPATPIVAAESPRGSTSSQDPPRDTVVGGASGRLRPPPPPGVQSVAGGGADSPTVQFLSDEEPGTMEGPTRRIRLVRSCNVIRAGPLFVQDVLTRMPYVETTTTSAFEITNVLCDPERVISLKTSEMLDMESLDVFLL